MSERFGLFMLGWIAAMMFIAALSSIFGAPGYKQGQIDAQTGKIVWHLKDLPDGTRVWTDNK